MQIRKLDATDSTNTYLKNWMVNEILEDYTIVVAKKQVGGRGQRGSSWESEPGKNLTFSILKRMDGFDIEHQFLITIWVSLAIYKTLKLLEVPALCIKWPNDIMSGNSKICGILIENVLQRTEIKSSVIGIGLNVNQESFAKLENVSSLKLLKGVSFNLNELLHSLILNLREFYVSLKVQSLDDLWLSYTNKLFRVNFVSTFLKADNKIFIGHIRGVNREGKLLIELEEGELVAFDNKEVRLLY